MKILPATLLLTMAVARASIDVCSTCRCVETLVDCTATRLDVDQPYPFDLTTLLLDRNGISTIRRMSSMAVVTLSFKDNDVATIADSAFIALDRLDVLILSHNQIETLSPDAFRGAFKSDAYEPLSVTTLDLSHNKIRSLDGKLFEHLPGLRELRLNDNPVGVIDSTTEMALSLSTLKILDLGNLGLSGLPENLPGSWQSLKELYLNGNNFTEIPESLAATGGTLAKLNLNDNRMRQLNANSFLGMHNLQVLNISACSSLEEIHAATFAQCHQLHTLYMSYNYNLTIIDKDAFRELKEAWPIKQLHLHHNALRSLSEELVPWEKLDYLDIQENPWTCDVDIYWMTISLLPKMKTDHPEDVTNIRCDEPIWMRGHQVLFIMDNRTFSNTTGCSSTTQCRRGLSVDRLAIVHPFITAIVLCTMLTISLAVFMVCRHYVKKHRHRFIVLNDVSYKRHQDEFVDDVYTL